MSLFTPFIKGDNSGKRLLMELDRHDITLIGKGRGWEAEITDQNTGIRWLAEAAACGAGCYCAASVTFLDAQRQEWVDE